MCLVRLLGGQLGLYVFFRYHPFSKGNNKATSPSSNHRHAEFDHLFLDQQHGQISASSRHRYQGIRISRANRNSQPSPLHMLPISRVVICVHITVGADRHCMDGGGIRGYLIVASRMTVRDSVSNGFKSSHTFHALMAWMRILYLFTKLNCIYEIYRQLCPSVYALRPLTFQVGAPSMVSFAYALVGEYLLKTPHAQSLPNTSVRCGSLSS